MDVPDRGSAHLWYLPFSLGAVALCAALLRLLSWPAICAVALSAAIGAVWLDNSIVFAIPLAQWISVVPAVAVGVCLVASRADLTRQNVVFGASLVIAALLVFGLGWQDAAWQSLVATALVALALRVPLPSTDLSQRLSSLSLGIYLVHPAIYAALLMGPNMPSLMLYVLVLLISAGVAGVIARIAPQFV